MISACAHDWTLRKRWQVVYRCFRNRYDWNEHCKWPLLFVFTQLPLQLHSRMISNYPLPNKLVLACLAKGRILATEPLVPRRGGAGGSQDIMYASQHWVLMRWRGKKKAGKDTHSGTGPYLVSTGCCIYILNVSVSDSDLFHTNWYSIGEASNRAWIRKWLQSFLWIKKTWE